MGAEMIQDNMEDSPDAGQAVLEQVFLNMPEAAFYFYSDQELTVDDVEAYIGSKGLQPVSLERYTGEEKETVYYLLLDVSASISPKQFRAILGGLNEWIDSLGPGDKVVLMTFGEEVEVAADGTQTMGELKDVLSQLKNEDRQTKLFEAVDRMVRMADRTGEISGSLRRVAMVITDGEDIACGVATRTESQQNLLKKGIPVYGFTVEGAKREAVNSFGEYVRASGGYLTILEQGAEAEGFRAFKTYIGNCYEGRFLSDTNQVTNAMVDVVLKLKNQGISLQRQVLQDRWIKDTESPSVSWARQTGERQIEVGFSEPVLGAGEAGHYKLEPVENGRHGPKGGLPPAAVSSRDGEMTAVLLFQEALPEGEYRLSFQGITDDSMEKNDLTGCADLLITARAAVPAGRISGLPRQGLLTGAGLLILVLAGWLIWRKKAVRHEEASVSDPVKVMPDSGPVHVVVREQEIERKSVEFLVDGKQKAVEVEIVGSIIVGRSKSCDLYFDDAAMSRQHFAIELRDGAFYLINLSRTGSTWVNGVKAEGNPCRLNRGDRITAGRLGMRIRWQEDGRNG